MDYAYSFAWASMPDSRPADSHLSYRNDSVYMDFSHRDDSIRLVRISFDGYGSNSLDIDAVIPMNSQDSSEFLKMYNTGIIEQSIMRMIITKMIIENQSLIWNDALREYGLLSHS